jgi:hypothetical protein
VKRKVILIDDDLHIVEEIRSAFEGLDIELVAPPALMLEIADIKKHLSDASLVILDLNIGGDQDSGEWYLRKLSRELSRKGIPVVVWSKYLLGTTAYEGNTSTRWDEEKGGWVLSEPNPGDKSRIDKIRKIYPYARAFVSKLNKTPTSTLLKVVFHKIPNERQDA